MLTLQCTQKLLKEVNAERSPLKDTDPVTLWHANLVILDRRKCVLFTNDQIRYSFLVTGLKKPDFKILDEMFRQNLFRNLMRDGLSQEAIEKVLDEVRKIAFTRTSNRCVLGTVKDMANIIKWTFMMKVGCLTLM